jgi:hypothetical protein
MYYVSFCTKEEAFAAASASTSCSMAALTFGSVTLLICAIVVKSLRKYQLV